MWNDGVKKLHFSRNNEGTSLIELVIALGIAAIVLSMIMLFLNGATRSFRHTSNEVNLQMESQTIMNQLSNLAMEAMDLEAYMDSPGELRYTFQYGIYDCYTIILDTDKGRLYQVPTTDFEQAKLVSYTTEEHFLAEYVEDLQITETPNGKSVIIDLTLSLGDRFSMTKKVNFRNDK